MQAPLDSPWFAAMADALRAEDPAAVVVPVLHGRRHRRQGVQHAGHRLLRLRAAGAARQPAFDYRAMAHGVDERVPVAGLDFGARVLDRFLLGV